MKDNGQIRQFDTGATRNTEEGKLDYESFFNPIILERFARYMHKHRKQSDGQLRDGDNWQQGFGKGKEHYNTCMKSMCRHFIDIWKEHRGYKSRNGIEDALCGNIFNSMAYLLKILEEKK